MAEVITVVATVAAMAEVITDLIIAPTLINLLEQKVGKIEVLEVLLRTLNTKMVGAGEKEESPMRAILQTIQINNPFLEVLKLI